MSCLLACRCIKSCGGLLGLQAPLPPRAALAAVWLTQRADMSTFEEMFNKVVTSPPVYFIEDTLAQFHDISGSFSTLSISTQS